MTDEWHMKGGPGIEAAVSNGRCYISGMQGSRIEIDRDDIERLIYLLTLMEDYLEAKG